jgi:hypothetical protein
MPGAQSFIAPSFPVLIRVGFCKIPRWWQKADCGITPRESKRGAARCLFAEVYDGFTEGFDTAGFQVTKALLHGLSKR